MNESVALPLRKYPASYLPALGRKKKWWLAGGVAGSACQGAYKAKGAASYAASLVNLHNPGVSDLAGTGHAPTWAAASGWTFVTAGLYLDTVNFVPDGAGTVIVRYVYGGSGNKVIFGYGAPWFAIQVDTSGAVNYIWGGTNNTQAPHLAAGVLALAAKTGYRNGVLDKACSGTWSGTPLAMLVGAYRQDSGAPGATFNGSVQAIAFYSVALTAAQVAAVSAQMAAM